MTKEVRPTVCHNCGETVEAPDLRGPRSNLAPRDLAVAKARGAALNRAIVAYPPGDQRRLGIFYETAWCELVEIISANPLDGGAPSNLVDYSAGQFIAVDGLVERSA